MFNISFRKLAKIFILNITITITVFTGVLEIFLRTNNNFKGTSFLATNYYSTIEEAAKSASAQDDLVLVVGDSFAAHQKGQGGNMFDLVYNCESKRNCNYFNISIPGTDVPTYWKSLHYVLQSRPKKAKTHIVMVLSYGTDFIVSEVSREKCSDEIIAQNPAPRQKTLKDFLKSSLAITYLYRSSKNVFSFGKNDEKSLQQRAEKLQNIVSSWKKNDSYKIFSRLPIEIKIKAKNDVINPWEIAVAMANPYYYQELYGMSKHWSNETIHCTSQLIESNLNILKKRSPNSTFTLLGFPDKFYWNASTSTNTLSEYSDLGFIMIDPSDSINERISKYLSQFSKSINIDFLHLPLILKGEDIDISKYFYKYDMHLNRSGNIELSKALRKYLDKRYN